jgi:putative transposase
VLGPITKRQITKELVHDYGVPLSRACKLKTIPRIQFYNESKKDDSELIEALQELAFKHPTYGFRKKFAYLPRGG